MDLSLFPNKEEWGTGDEAMDNKLSVALKQALAPLSFDSICQFYFLGMSLKTRAYNPGFGVTIELVTKALFHLLSPNEEIDHLMKKMKGDYFHKTRINFQFEDKEQVLSELRAHKKFRYRNQLDFSVNLQNPKERNPYVREELKRSTIDLSVKVIFKDFKNFLNNDPKAEAFSDPFFLALKGTQSILVIENFAEIWYHQDQIFSLSLMP